jgi:hypothetical protein
MLFWAFCFHVSFIDLFISLEFFFFSSFLSILVSFDNKVMQVCWTLWDQGHGNLFKAP